MSLREDRTFLKRLGVEDPRHRKIILDALPCGIQSVARAYRDGTPWQTNAPRAIMICYWKGMVDGFARVEREKAGRG